MIEDSMNEAISTLRLMSHARRELIVISDFQDTDWQSFQSTHAGSFAKQFAVDADPALELRFCKLANLSMKISRSIPLSLRTERLELASECVSVSTSKTMARTQSIIRNSFLKWMGVKRSISQFSIAFPTRQRKCFSRTNLNRRVHIS